jgi:putative ABC transport system substrate-binding protein
MRSLPRRQVLQGLAYLGLGTAAWPLLAACGDDSDDKPAQQTKIARIGLLEATGQSGISTSELTKYHSAVDERGWSLGTNYIEEWRYADGHTERLPALAEELVKLPVDIILPRGPGTLAPARAATSTIPILVTAGVIDPVADGLATAQSRPTGNVTGILEAPFAGVAGKLFDLTKEALPGTRRLGILWDANPPRGPLVPTGPAAAPAKELGLELYAMNAYGAGDFDRVFPEARAAGVDVVVDYGVFLGFEAQIAEVARRYRLPVVSQWPTFTEAGGLLTIRTDPIEYWRTVVDFIDRILRGEQVKDLPFRRVDKLSILLNLKTAKELGLTIPRSFLVQVTELIE